jgi:DNA adenine methylase
MKPTLKAPFPWFGGKSRAASLIWSRFGDCPNYVEPFAGSLAVLLARPTPPRTETVNDLDCYLSNFWRAIAHDPEATAKHADWPVNEADLLARHRWLDSRVEFRQRIRADAMFFDPQIAGWWVWGLCQWIGDGWCRQRRDGDQPEQLPHMGNAGTGINRKLPHMGDAGMGINRKLPHMGDGERGECIAAYFVALSDRLRDVRVACGDWARVVSPACTTRHGMTAILLDPPYDGAEHDVGYSAGGNDVSAGVRQWAIDNGANPLLRIALCGYEGEHAMPADWECVPWLARKGYQAIKEGEEHSGHRERIWFSPGCQRAEQGVLL